MSENIQIGKIVKPHGYNGELTIRIEQEYQGILDELEHLLVEYDYDSIPFNFTVLAKKNKGHFKVSIDGVSSEAEAMEMKGKALYAAIETVEEINPFHDADNEFIGFRVIDENLGSLGTVELYDNYSGNQVMEVKKEDGDIILIPIHEDFIQKIDSKEKAIYTQLPEGILDLND